MKYFFNQKVTIHRKCGVNEFGEPQTETIKVNARWQGRLRTVRDRFGNEVVAQATCYSPIKVAPDDMIEHDGIKWVVVTVAERVGLDGEIVYWEVAL